uniref:Uncharacterized protein n=1 Tax=Spumella elongata TaxID=89044 RepID=A0A7S3GRX7_9STRA
MPGAKRNWLQLSQLSQPTAKKVLQMRGACNRAMPLNLDYFYMGRTENGSPMYRSPSADFIYYGPDCSANGGARRWTISPALCNEGYYDGYLVSNQSSSPPETGIWYMRCQDGWEKVNLTLSVVVQVNLTL